MKSSSAIATPRSLTIARLALWFFAMLGPTVVLRWLSLRWTLGHTPAAVGFTGVDGLASAAWFFGGHLVTADAVDCAVIVLVALTIGRGLFRVRLSILASVSLFVLMLFGALNAFSVRETGSQMTLEGLRLAIRWLVGNPAAARESLTATRAAALSAVASWALVPLLADRAIVSRRDVRLVLTTAAALVLVASLALRPDELVPDASSPSIARGFWRSAATSMTGPGPASPLGVAVRSEAERMAAYERLAYPDGRARMPAPLVAIPPAQRVARHILIVKLETAPRAYYPIDGSRPDLPTFRAMSRHGIVSDRHYTTAPMTDLAGYSMLSGMYPRAGVSLSHFGDFHDDGLVSVLNHRGYESTYIDSFVLRWNGEDEARTVRDLGFQSIHDAVSDPLPRERDEYRRRVRREEYSMDLAVRRILEAESRGRKALVCVMTQLGHYAWPAVTDNTSGPGAPLLAVAKEIDRLLGRALDTFDAHGLGDDVLVVVTGDHGLRFESEFAALSQAPRFGDLTFNVPLLIYARALFPSTIRLPYVTSHADLAPTLLELVGEPRPSGYHGDDMLDRRLAGRVTFFLSAEFPGLYPISGFHYANTFYQRYDAVGRVTRRAAGTPREQVLDDGDGSRFSEADVEERLDEARALFNESAAVLLRRATQAEP